MKVRSEGCKQSHIREVEYEVSYQDPKTLQPFNQIESFWQLYNFLFLTWMLSNINTEYTQKKIMLWHSHKDHNADLNELAPDATESSLNA